MTLLARTAREITEAAGSIRDAGGQADVLTLDVTDLPAFRAATDTLDSFDILINNAGTNRPRPFLEVTEDDYDVITALNQRAAYFVAQIVARKMASAGKGGSIIHISSQMGHVGGQNRTVYCMTKHGIEGLTKAMAIDLAPLGIRVNSIGPTFIDTPLTKPFFQNVAFPRRCPAEDQVGAARFGRGPDGCRSFPGRRLGGVDHRHIPGGGRRLDGGLGKAASITLSVTPSFKFCRLTLCLPTCDHANESVIAE